MGNPPPAPAPLRVDGALLDNFRLTHGFWEAKHSRRSAPREARKKFDLGYPRDNILFQSPRRALLFQNDTLAFDADLTQPPALIDALSRLLQLHPARLHRMGARRQRVPGARARPGPRAGRDDRAASPRRNQRFHAGLCRISPSCARRASTRTSPRPPSTRCSSSTC